MLVLTRKSNETITIGNEIKITIVRVKGNKVRIGIDAPADVRVVRGELARQADDNRLSADGAASPEPGIPALTKSLASPVVTTSVQRMPVQQRSPAGEKSDRGPLSRCFRHGVDQTEDLFVAMGVTTVETS